jgi:leucyl aminopeptidase
MAQTGIVCVCLQFRLPGLQSQNCEPIMSQRLKLEVKALNAIGAGSRDPRLGRWRRPKRPRTGSARGAHSLLARAAAAERFKGKALSGLTLLAPDGAGYERLIVVGIGPEAERGKLDFAKLGGAIAGRLGHGRSADVILALPDGEIDADQVADIALGMRLRAYAFDRYKTKSKEKDEAEPIDGDAARGRPRRAQESAEGARGDRRAASILARDLVNEPPNVLFPKSSPTAPPSSRSSASRSRFSTRSS